MSETERWPLDTRLLNKGDLIPPERLESIVGLPRTDPGFAFEKMQIAAFIESSRAAAGEPLVVKHEQYGLRILTDAEAAEYLDRRFRDAQRTAARVVFKQASFVNCEELTLEQRLRHERAILNNSRVLQAAKRERLQITREERKLHVEEAKPV